MADPPNDDDNDDNDNDDDVIIDDDDENDADDVYPGFNSAFLFVKKERIPSNSARGASIWNTWRILKLALKLNVNVEDLVAVLQIESGGKGFDKTRQTDLTIRKPCVQT